MNRSLAAIAFVCTAAVTLAACSGGGGGNPTPAPTGAATAAPAASATGTAKPGSGAPLVNSVTWIPGQALNTPTVLDDVRVEVKATDPDGDGVVVDYKWFVNGREIIGEASDTFRAVPGRVRKGDKLEVGVYPRDTRGNAGPPFASYIMIRDAIPTITSRPTGSLNGYRAVVADADIGDPNERFVWSLEAPVPPGFKISSDGVLSFDAVAGKEASGKNLTIVVTDSAGSLAKQTFDIRF